MASFPANVNEIFTANYSNLGMFFKLTACVLIRSRIRELETTPSSSKRCEIVNNEMKLIV